MRDFFSTLGAQVRELWQGLNTWQRGLLVGVPVLAIVVVIALIVSLPGGYTTLYANLAESDRLDVERELLTMGVPFESDQTLGSVAVLPEDEDRARMVLAEQGLPRAALEGWGVLDRQRMGATERMQRTNFQRALEQVLTRTINSLETVRASQVHLTIPEPAIFTERETPPKATVVLTFRQGAMPEESEVRGIANLVSGAVDGLIPENVTINDSRGKVISKTSDAISMVEGERRALRRVEEEPRVQKINAFLNEMFGNRIGEVDADGGMITSIASVSVTADVNHDLLETESTTYDPETVVSKEQITSENSEGVPIPSAVGVPGVTSNIVGAGAVSGAGTYTNEESITEYQSGVTRTVAQEKPKLISLSTTVSVNAAVLPGVTPIQDLSDRTLDTPEMRQVRSLVASAVGYDGIDPAIKEPTVEFMRYAPMPGAPLPAVVITTWWRNPWIIAAILGATSLALMAFLLLKPRLARKPVEEEAEALPGVDEEELQALLARQRDALDEEEKEQHRRRRQALADLADANPEEIGRVMQHWGEAN
ncbi:flagellar M-ring protein FliF [Candidatus Poribacteria bacterium]|jgi:flagellar M-ring protein FliF|nr:flagellar M-ring protein FliF [Candidatus Poribacteria bacterium]MBT5532001.1 flagellar M-ring protein FliF [Candidatus Poribacteria bacterium]MBT5714243.1 flagellar M-ring protein FliF [Candidatus Poribacteria bacterium]MBT7809137.1 flagellar M-ring protein FliF [Candidatus Poribacteria bacterium]